MAHAGVIAGNMCDEPRSAPDPRSSDQVQAYNAEGRAYPDDDDAQRRLGLRGRALARRLLRRHWILVDQIGSALAGRSALSLDEVEALLSEAYRPLC
jgi:hypothetical protein